MGMKFYVNIFVICALLLSTEAWDTEELEIFDLVEEINRNFYEFMGIIQNATSNDVKRAFRSLSIQLHPDKNPSEDANIQFRNLVSIYEVLKDPGKRGKYDKVLRDGLPNWKSALYYYRRMRKIGLYEAAGILFVFLTVGQYLFAWAAYVEKRYTAEQILGSKLKKLQKKNKSIDIDMILNEIPTPSLKNTLPIQIPVFIWNIPKMMKEAASKAKELKKLALEKQRQEMEEAKRLEILEKEAEEQARLRKEKKENLRKRKENHKVPEKTDEELRGYSQIQIRELTEDDAIRPAAQKTGLTGGFWTDEDLAELIRLVKKYPCGSSSRWNSIAEAMNRTVQEVTFMAAKMKENGYRTPGQAESAGDANFQGAQKEGKRDKSKKEKATKNILIPETNWTQDQQKALEEAIIKYPKSSVVGDRWQRIADYVPGKSKEECLTRYKYLCELVKAQKRSEGEDSVDENSKNCERRQNSTICHSNENSLIQYYQEAQSVADEINELGDKKRTKRKDHRKKRDLVSTQKSDEASAY
uniref:DnaJ homolog subfamily C member 1 n=1 Tax=Glossina pallidipes TaxID=7398 RepID=A0A1B0AFH8_GLOPL